MNRRVSMLWQQHASYWRALPYRRNLQQQIAVLIRDLFTKVSATTDATSRVRTLFKRTNYDLVRVLVVTGVGYLVDLKLFRPYYRTTFSLSEDRYQDALLAVTGLSGVFIGLYYAALSAVGSTIYAQFPVNIRSLLKEERSGAIYMRFLSWLGFGCLALAALNVCGAPPSLLSLVFVVLFSAVAVFGFAYLGRAVFDYFDPSSLSHEVYVSVQRQIKKVATGSNAPSLSESHRAARFAAANSLMALREIQSIIAPRAHLQDSYIQFVRNTIRLSVFYFQHKQKINPRSAWYPQQQGFDDWYRTSESSTSIYVRAGIYGIPTSSTDLNWVEDVIEPILRDSIKDSLQNSAAGDASMLLSEAIGYVRHRAYHGEIDDALALADHALESFVAQTISRSDDGGAHDWVFLADAVASIYVEALTHYRAWHVEKTGADLQAISALDWTKRSVLSAAPSGPRYVPLVLEIADQIRFELTVEGRRITPSWFIDERFRSLLCARIASQLPRLVSASQTLLAAAQRLWGASRHDPALALFSRLLEFLTKFDGYLGQFEATSDALIKTRLIKGLMWPDPDYSAQRAMITEVRAQLLSVMSNCIQALPPYSSDSKLPDYAGQFLDTLGHQLLDALWNKAPSQFVPFYEGFLAGSIIRTQGLLPRNALPEHLQAPAFGVALAPLVDAMEIAGIGVVVAQAFGLSEIERAIHRAWQDFFADPEGSEARKRLVAVAAQFSLQPMNPIAREVTRTGWRQEMLATLSDLPRRTARSPGRVGSSYTVIDHPAALVRAVAGDRVGLSWSGLNVFCIEILRDIPAALGIELGFLHEDIVERVRRAEQNGGDLD